MIDQPKLEILAFTDPVCTWCWGAEPVLRKLQAWFKDQILITPVMGGLVKDIRDFRDLANGIGGDPETSNAQIARHWLEASARHRMPVRTEGFKLFSADTFSTYPQNIAYKAVELIDSTLAKRYLRRIREASAAEARETGKHEVLIELASEVGIDITAMISNLENSSARLAFSHDLEMIQKYGVHGFPSFLVRYERKELMLRGFQSYAAMRSVISYLAGERLQEHPPEVTKEAVLSYLQTSGRAAPVELETVFDLSTAKLESMLNSLEAEQYIRRTPAGNGYFLEPAAAAGSCDPVSGICAV